MFIRYPKSRVLDNSSDMRETHIRPTCLTRHWYDRDAVGEALHLTAAATKDPFRKRKLLFWTYELVLSEEWKYLWATLEKVALRWGSSATLAAFQPASTDPQTVLDFLQSLLSLPTAAPYDPPVDSESVLEISDKVPEKPAAWTVGQRTRLWLAVQDALRHRRPLRLLRLLGGLAPQVAAEYLGVQTTKKGIYHMLEMVGCPVLPTPVAIDWPDIPVGRVAARLFALPRSVLPTGPIDPLITKMGCAFWRRIWSTVEEDTIWNTYFADDIPDEWSAAEQAKSHLVGSLDS